MQQNFKNLLSKLCLLHYAGSNTKKTKELRSQVYIIALFDLDSNATYSSMTLRAILINFKMLRENNTRTLKTQFGITIFPALEYYLVSRCRKSLAS